MPQAHDGGAAASAAALTLPRTASIPCGCFIRHARFFEFFSVGFLPAAQPRPHPRRRCCGLCLPKQNAQIKIVLQPTENRTGDIAFPVAAAATATAATQRLRLLLLLLCLTNSLDSKFIGHLKE